jgi:ATP-binding cassette, subfamily C, type I secretion system permease/ATPase
MDGAPFHQWDADQLGHAIGYLPQEIELFDGTFDENIARFTADVPSEAVIDAATLAGVHDLILGFPDGYKTQIGEAGAKLSAGQRQRIGLHVPFTASRCWLSWMSRTPISTQSARPLLPKPSGY